MKGIVMVNTTDARAVVISSLAETMGLPAETIDPSKSLESIGVDSLTFLRLQIFLEETFKISIPDDTCLQSTSVEDIVKIVSD